jgi:hypothetical protein
MTFAPSGCSGMEALSEHGNLDVHTHMSDTVFLDPIPASQKTIYIGVRNTSDYPEIDARSPWPGPFGHGVIQSSTDRMPLVTRCRPTSCRPASWRTARAKD